VRGRGGGEGGGVGCVVRGTVEYSKQVKDCMQVSRE